MSPTDKILHDVRQQLLRQEAKDFVQETRRKWRILELLKKKAPIPATPAGDKKRCTDAAGSAHARRRKVDDVLPATG